MKQSISLILFFLLTSFFFCQPMFNYAEDVPTFTDADLEKYGRKSDSRIGPEDDHNHKRIAPAPSAPMPQTQPLILYENKEGGAGVAMPMDAYERAIKIKSAGPSRTIKTPVSPLRSALWKKQEEIALQLIKNGAVLEENDPAQDDTANPLLVMALEGDMFRAANALIDRGADVNGIKYDYPLMSYFIAYNTRADSVPGVVSFLCDHDADVERRPIRSGATPLMIAASKGHQHVVKLLLSHGANINARYIDPPGYVSSDQGATALGFAAGAGHMPIVKLLLSKGADVSLKKTNGYTPLIDALNLGHHEVAKILITNKADVNAETIEHITPLKAALRKNNLQMAQFLVDKGAEVNAKSMKGYVFPLMDHGDFETAKFIVANGLNLSEPYEGTTPLYYAAQRGLAAYVELFISHKANVNDKNQIGRTPLMAAAENGHITTVKLLLANGADIHAIDSAGLNAFVLAKQKGHDEVAGYLQARGADTAVYLKQSELISIMKNKGFIPHDADPENPTPQYLEYIQLALKEMGIEDVRKWKPNPQYSAPERTWEHYRKALLAGDFDAAQKCHVPGIKLVDVYKQMGMETTRKIVSNMGQLQKISEDSKRATYLLVRSEDGRDISYEVNFSNVFGEWKIEHY